MILTDGQLRALEFAASGGVLDALRPGSNRHADVEYLVSQKGTEIFCEGTDVAELVVAGLLVASETEPHEIDDDLVVTHQLRITDAGRMALTRR
jgi:hypothetical protein